MAGFLRKKVTLSRKVSARDPKTPSSPNFVASPDRLSSDVPPSLPPLILSASFADPDPDPVRPLAASPPVVPVPTSAPEPTLGDLWDPWKAYALDVSAPSQPAKPSSVPQGRPSASNASVLVPTVSNVAVSRSGPVATGQSPRPTSSRQAQTRQQVVHPKSDEDPLGNRPLSQTRSSFSSHPRPASPPPPPVLRGQMSPSANFDFEESLSAANVTSVVNQFRSYPPPIRHHASPAPPSLPPQTATQRPPSSNAHRHHTAPQKPGSSSTLSSTSHHTDPTRRTDGSCATSSSTSSVSRPPQVNGRLDPVSNSHPSVEHNDPSTRVDYDTSRKPSFHSRPFTAPNSSPRAHRSPTVPPPTSYSDRVRTLDRQTSHSSLSSNTHSEHHPRTPMLYDMLRSGNAERRGPLIFAAHQPASRNPMPPPTNRHSSIHSSYPSPPTEYTSLESSSPSRRNGPVPAVFRGAPQADLRSHQSPLVSPILHSTELPPLAHKSSKSNLRVAIERPSSAVSRGDSASDHARPRVLTKARSTTPQKQGTPCHKVLPAPGDPLLLDDDPFARNQGVKMLRPRTSSGDGVPSSSPESKDDICLSEDGLVKTPSSSASALSTPLTPVSPDAPMPSSTPPPSAPEQSPPTPVTPDDYKTARQRRRGQWLEKAPPPAIAEVVAKQLATEEEEEEVEEQPREPTPPPPTYFPIMAFMSDANLFPLLLSYLSYPEWLALYSANNQVRELFQSRILREFVLERFLSTVGYSKWDYEWAEPMALSLKDLHNYLRGVAMPAHQYGRLSRQYLQAQTANRDAPATSETPDILALALTTRAYTRVVLRLRAQAESEARYLMMQLSADSNPPTNTSRPGTRPHSASSRAPSPTSSRSHSRNHSHGKNERRPSASSARVSKFKSPLYRLGRAPVLRVFVPSPEGDWLSDAGVMECEAELKRSGVLKLLRVGDIVWDVAVGDEGNLGRLIWDGSYLVDLDYRYSRVGELSPYFHNLAFAPSYFHRVIRIGGSATHNPHCNPLVYIDVSPWGQEIGRNLQLLQDRARTETPHGALHDVVRWVHRSTFIIRPPLPPSQGQGQPRSRSTRVPIPNVEGFYIDPGWYGKVVLESEGTNEGLADLQARCGPGVFPPRAESLATKIRNEKEKDNRRVWRILREKSRPGEIWLRAVQVQERLM